MNFTFLSTGIQETEVSPFTLQPFRKHSMFKNEGRVGIQSSVPNLHSYSQRQTRKERHSHSYTDKDEHKRTFTQTATHNSGP